MKVLFLGDIIGRAGRQAVIEALPRLRDRENLDFIVVNGENATGGAGLNSEHAKALLVAGADCITLGDHAFDQKEMISFIDQEPRIIRPLNFAKNATTARVSQFLFAYRSSCCISLKSSHITDLLATASGPGGAGIMERPAKSAFMRQGCAPSTFC